jgi:dTDP-4-amino-4,6-dideoxygalactose transaminase
MVGSGIEDDRMKTERSQTDINGVPLLDLKGQYESIKNEIDEAISRVVDIQRFIMGPEVEALEEEIGRYCGTKHAVGVSSGTDALIVSLMALDISSGDEVITSPFTFFSTVGSILRLGASVIFADIDPDTFNIDPVKVERLITDKTKAIIPVHLFGQCADMDPLLKMAKKNSVPIVEDAAQAIGARYRGRSAGSMGTTGCFSFFPSKNLGAFGDGGMVTTNDGDLADRIKLLRNHGSETKYVHKMLGGNFRLDSIQAAVLRVKLRYLDSWSEKRHANATYYTKRLQFAGLDGTKIVTPSIIHENHVFNQYVIRAEERDRLREFLTANGVGTEIYYHTPIHLQECVNDGRFRAGDLPIAEEACSSVLALPIFPELSEAQKDYIVETIEQYYRRRP